MTDDFSPDPEPGGALVPPRRHPPTAVGTATPPPPRPSRPVRTRVSRGWLGAVRAGLNVVLDAADQAGDAIAEAMGLRGRPGAPPSVR